MVWDWDYCPSGLVSLCNFTLRCDPPLLYKEMEGGSLPILKSQRDMNHSVEIFYGVSFKLEGKIISHVPVISISHYHFRIGCDPPHHKRFLHNKVMRWISSSFMQRCEEVPHINIIFFLLISAADHWTKYVLVTAYFIWQNPHPKLTSDHTSERPLFATLPLPTQRHTHTFPKPFHSKEETSVKPGDDSNCGGGGGLAQLATCC